MVQQQIDLSCILVRLTVILGLTAGAAAQNDGFIYNGQMYNDMRTSEDQTMLGIPDGGQIGNQSPLGGGLLVLTALGAGYAALRR
ncbi:MAG: hypothetical protein KBT67_11045 [bacterium]|nr:hypothetical protein [Candidatus Limimorpha caballi]